MSSSTSNSEREARWTGFARLFVGAALGGTLLLLAAALLLDPYDAGRGPLSSDAGLRPLPPRFAAASRGRDLSFDSAILGNSHVQMLEPAALSGLTGRAFVSLATPGTGPRETLALLAWFARHRPAGPSVLVIGIDQHWCTADPGLPTLHPYPFWLIDPSPLAYLHGLISQRVLEELPRRVGFLLAGNPARASRDGFWDYGPDFAALGAEAERARRAALERPIETGGGNATGPFPAAAALFEALAGLPARTKVILLRPPAYITALPRPGSADAGADAACRQAYAAVAASRDGAVMRDWRIDRPELHDPNRFFDHTHYRQPLARLVEAEIAAALAPAAAKP